MRTQWSVLRVVAAATIFFAGPIRAQTGAVPVDLQARILDLTSTPPAAPKDISEPFDAVSGTGLKLVFDLDYGNVVLYTTNPNSQLLKSFGVPGFSGDAGSVHYPWTSYYFYSSINKLNNSSGFLAGSLLVNSGLLTLKGGSSASTGIVYSGSWDNPLWQDRSVPDQPFYMEAPLHDWADLVPGDTHACTSMPPGVVPQGRFVILTQRHGCDWSARVKNIESAGAIGWIIYNDDPTDELPSDFTTPNTSIPVVFIRAADGAAIIDQLKRSAGSAVLNLHPTNVQGFVSGTYQVGADGTLQSVNLNFQLSNALDAVLTGTLTTPVR